MISEHFAALKARLEADGDLAGVVHDTVRLDSNGGLIRSEYVILYRSSPRIDSDRLAAVAGPSSTLTFDVEVRAVGRTSAKCGAVMDRILTQFAGHRLVVAGRSCSPMTIQDTGRVVADTSVKEFLYFANLAFEFVSEPA